MTQGLTVHPGVARGLLAAMAFKDERQRQKTPHAGAVVVRGGDPPKPFRRVLDPRDPDRCSHHFVRALEA